jgi:hypothetical protein
LVVLVPPDDRFLLRACLTHFMTFLGLEPPDPCPGSSADSLPPHFC